MEKEPKKMRVIKIYGMGCARCRQLYDNALAALELVDEQGAVVKVEDLAEIAAAGVMSTPGIEIDGRMISQGRLMTTKQLADVLKELPKPGDELS